MYEVCRSASDEFDECMESPTCGRDMFDAWFVKMRFMPRDLTVSVLNGSGVVTERDGGGGIDFAIALSSDSLSLSSFRFLLDFLWFRSTALRLCSVGARSMLSFVVVGYMRAPVLGLIVPVIPGMFAASAGIGGTGYWR